MRLWGLYLLIAACAASGCQSPQGGFDPFLGPQRIAAPPTGSAAPNGTAPYFVPGSTTPAPTAPVPSYPSTTPTTTPGVSSPYVPPGGTYNYPAGTHNYQPSALRSDGAAGPARPLIPQPSDDASASARGQAGGTGESRIGLPAKAASWSGGAGDDRATRGDSVRIVEPAGGVSRASFTRDSSSAATSTAVSAPIEAGPVVDITSLPDAKRK